MITVEEADKIISLNIEKFPSVQVPLQDAFGMVLQEDLIADRDLPPFDRVTMDGIGIKFN
ncbi:MAG: molybdopterin molybdenumtransferase MoeA, partial [Candidatus Omnitrophica bacterium]|nr:molybdopterin molybdenumtransferase MoeA [Candidatus Omnitrophota bacterium]